MENQLNEILVHVLTLVWHVGVPMISGLLFARYFKDYPRSIKALAFIGGTAFLAALLLHYAWQLMLVSVITFVAIAVIQILKRTAQPVDE